MLENAVSSIDDLRQVQIQAAHDKVRTRTAITYEQYVSLLMSGAMIHDSRIGDTKPSKLRSQRQVYSHDIDTDVSYSEQPDTFDEWEVYNASYDRGPRLSKDQWLCLAADARGKWDELSPDKSKHIILEAKTRHSQPHPPRKANFHELT
jgi:hypothetical protein